MDLFGWTQEYGHEQVVFCSNREVGLKAIICIHDTTLGAALGGARMWPYQSEQDALRDVLRLSRGMTYKAACAGLNLGGGKAVIIGDPKQLKSEALFRTFGRFVDSLNGRYITAEDVNTNVDDMEYVRMETKHVTGISRALGGSGDPSPLTAIGTYYGMKAAVKKLKGSDSLEGMRIAVQGCGQVAYHLIKLLDKENTRISVCDIDQQKIKRVCDEVTVDVVENPNDIYGIDADIFSPCALGDVLNSTTIPKIKAPIIAGAANNQLGDEDVHGELLFKKGVLYVPDFVINAGGLINVYNELLGYNRNKAVNETKNIYNIVTKILETSERENIHTQAASTKLAEQRIALIGGIKKTYSNVPRVR